MNNMKGGLNGGRTVANAVKLMGIFTPCFSYKKDYIAVVNNGNIIADIIPLSRDTTRQFGRV